MPTVLRTGSKAATADTSLFRMVSLNASKFPMKSRRGTILSKRTRIKKTDKPRQDPGRRNTFISTTFSHNVYYVIAEVATHALQLRHLQTTLPSSML